MKRTPLNRKTPLKQGTKQMKRGGELKKSPLKKRSAKTKAKYVDRRALVERLLKERPQCEACRLYAVHEHNFHARPLPSEHLHEIVLRSQGGDILDESIIVVVCAKCHQKVDENRNVAELLGLYLRSFNYTPEAVAEAKRVRESWANNFPVAPYYLY